MATFTAAGPSMQYFVSFWVFFIGTLRHKTLVVLVFRKNVCMNEYMACIAYALLRVGFQGVLLNMLRICNCLHLQLQPVVVPCPRRPPAGYMNTGLDSIIRRVRCHGALPPAPAQVTNGV